MDEEFGIIESGFNDADETINFGTRAIGYDSLYEISTVACLKCEENTGVEKVFLNAQVKDGKFILTVNKSIKVFEDANLSAISFNAVFDSVIDTVCMSPDGKFLLLCLRSGMVHIFNVEDDKESNCIFSKSMTKNDSSDVFYINSYLEHFTCKFISFIIISQIGKIHRMSISLRNDSEDDSTSNIVVSLEEIYNVGHSIHLASFSYPNVLLKSYELLILNLENLVTKSSAVTQLKTICSFGHKFLALDEEGHLLRICSLTLLIFNVEDTSTLFDDILVLNDNRDNKQIVAYTKKNELGESYLQLLNSDYSVIFSLKMKYPLHLIQLDNATDETLVLSKIPKNDSLIYELRIQCVYETQPELRLTRLIKKQNFEEAEKFAKMFNLNPALVLKARAKLIVDKPVCTSEDVTTLIEILKAVDDDYFKLQCCSDVDCSDYEDVRKILNYGSTIIPKSNHENKEAVLLLQKLQMDLLFKFDTYMAIYSYYDLQMWSKFCSCDLIEELKIFLKNFQFEEAIIIYSRLDLVTANKLTDKKIEEILLILNNLPINICQPFLLTFIPVTMMNRPTTLPIFVNWLKNKIFQMEKRDNSSFPDNSIKFAENILKLLKVEESGCLYFQRQCMLNKDVLNDLAVLMESLRSLQLLKNNFRINISLSDYLMGPKTVIRTLLNIVMPPEDYDFFLKEFLYKYLIQNNFEPDEIFLDEIKNLIKYNEDCWIKIVESLINHINSVKFKLEAIKEILENTQVPWSDAVRAIGQSALQYNHPLVSDIKNILEDEPRFVVLKNPKYKIKEKQITTSTELEWIVKRIIYINEPFMVNDVFQLCKSQKDKREVTIILVKHFIDTKNYEEAMSTLDKIGNKQDIYYCTKWFASYAEIMINNETSSPKYKEIYYQFLGPLFRRLIDNNENITQAETFNDLRILRAVYNLNKTFSCNVSSNDLRSASKSKQIFEELIEEIVDGLNKGSVTLLYAFDLCDKLAACFAYEKDIVLLKLSEKVAKYSTILKLAEHLYKNESSSKNLCLAAMLLLKYMGSIDVQLPCDSFSDDSSMELDPVCPQLNSLIAENSSTNFISGVKLSEQMIIKALINTQDDELAEVVLVMNWVNSCFYLTRTPDNLQMELFKHSFHLEYTVPSYSIFGEIKNIFTLYCNLVGNSKCSALNERYSTYFMKNGRSLTEDQLLQEISSLSGAIDNFCREGQQLTIYKLLVRLDDGLKLNQKVNPSIQKLLDTILLKKCLPQLIRIVVSSKHIDIQLFLNLLLVCQKDYHKYIQLYLKLYKRQPKKLHDIATVGIKVLSFHKVSTGKEVFITAIVTCKWWNRLKAKITDIPYEIFFKTNADNRLRLLLGLEILDVTMIQEYCSDYNLDLQVYYMVYLKSLLVNWKPDYECRTDVVGKKLLYVKNDETHLYNKCIEIIHFIKDKDAVHILLDKIWDVANFYHYEVFICILKILGKESRNEKIKTLDLPMLMFLKDYRRFSTPSQSEKELWYSTYPDTQVLDPLSEFRLPFVQTLFTYDVWNIIRPEISLNSYRYWFDAINILRKNLKKDDICIYAVKEVVTSGVLGKEVAGVWTLYPKFEDLFHEVDECVQNMSDLERATSVVYHLMYHTPNGADKVNAARLSFKYAKMYKEQNPNSLDVDKAFIKVKTKYYSFSAIHILHVFQLAEDKYIRLVAQPEDLIHALYKDERIVNQAERISLGCPDINKTVDTLGELFELQVDQIKYNLVCSLLNSSDIDMDFDTTIFTPAIKNVTTSGNDNLKRATYICSSGEKSFWQGYLLRVGTHDEDEDSEHKNFSFKANALKCFCAISDVETITKVTELAYKEFLNYIDKLTLLSELECLAISLNVESLDQYNKKDLLKRLSQINNPMAVKVMATICITYIIEDMRYWEFIINSTIRLELYTELKLYVDFLKNKCYKKFYINAWQVIIDHAFHMPNMVSNEELCEIYVNNFLMIQSCPVLYSLNFEDIVRKCIKSEKIEFAAVLLQYLPEEKKEVYAKMISPNRTLLLSLDNLSKSGIWGIRNIKSWLAQKFVI